jgi:hypothetical protein
MVMACNMFVAVVVVVLAGGDDAGCDCSGNSYRITCFHWPLWEHVNQSLAYSAIGHSPLWSADNG